MGTTMIISARWQLFLFLVLYLSYFGNGLGKLSLWKHRGGALKCYLGINLRGKTSRQHPVRNLTAATCTKPHGSNLYETSRKHPV